MNPSTMLDDYHAWLIRRADRLLDANYAPSVAVEMAAYVLWLQGSWRGGLVEIKACLERRRNDKRFDKIVGEMVFAMQCSGIKTNRWRNAA